MGKNISRILPYLISFFFVYSTFAQYLNVQVNPTSMYCYGEESIKLNPKNPNQVVIGVIAYYPSLNTSMGYCYSTNSGLNWSCGPLLSTLGQPGSDPVIIVDTLGNFYYITCVNWGVPGPNLDKLLCLKSTNGGMNWNNGTIFAQLYPQMDDMPMACVDFSNSSFGNNIYVTWTLYDSMGSHNPLDSSYAYISSSSDGGSSFSISRRVSRIAGHGYYDNSCPEGPVPCTGTNGEVYVCYPYNEQVLFQRSTDGGVTWLANDVVVCSQPGGWYPYHSPVIACDLSTSPHTGNVYICFSDLRNGVNDRDIWLVKSTNRGDNWSNPVRVNDDGLGNVQMLPWIDVDRVTGYIWILFYDTRNHTNFIADLYLARSTDWGNTFQNSKVSSSTSNIASWQGDYIGVSVYNNKVRPVWSRTITPYHNEVWTAIVDTFTTGVKPTSNKVPEKFYLFQNYPNPFNPLTRIKFEIPYNKSETKGMYVKLLIYDLLGHDVSTLVNEKLQPGTYEVQWDASHYPSGIYFYKIITNNFTDTKKLVLLK